MRPIAKGASGSVVRSEIHMPRLRERAKKRKGKAMRPLSYDYEPPFSRRLGDERRRVSRPFGDKITS
jgi:hypothetical protein